MNKTKVDIRTIDFNKVDDLRILLLLSDKKVNTLAKEYVFRKYIKRIKLMDFQYLSLLLLEIDSELLEICNDLIKNIFDDLSVIEVESLVYANKSYTNVSKVIVNLFNYNWFFKDIKYLMIKEAYELEKHRDDIFTERKIVRIANKIIGELANDHYFELMDKILKNYLYILDKNNPDFVLEFREKGYKYIDNCIKKNKDITKNMLVFDAYMMKYQNSGKYLVDLEFYDNARDSKYANNVNNLVRINLASLMKINGIEGDRKFAIQYLFFANSREFIMAYFGAYLKMPKSIRLNLLEELMMHNMEIARSLKKIIKKREHIEHYTDEYCANVLALKELYKRYDYLKSLNNDDKRKFNAYICKTLIKSYKSLDSKKTYNMSPVEYTFKEVKEYREMENKQNYLLDRRIDLTTSLELVEKNLNELEKLELGYPTSYINRLVSISKNELQVIDIFSKC